MIVYGDIEGLVKVKKPLQKPCTKNLAKRRIQKDRDESKLYKIENVTVKKTRGAASGDIFARHLAAHQRIWN